MKALEIDQRSLRKASAWLTEKFTESNLRFDDPKAGEMLLFESLEVLSLGIEGEILSLDGSNRRGQKNQAHHNSRITTGCNSAPGANALASKKCESTPHHPSYRQQNDCPSLVRSLPRQAASF